MALNDKQTKAEHALLEIVLDLHPGHHLTIPELILKVAADRDKLEGEEIRHAIRDLRASGVLRYPAGVVEPTHAAVRTVEILSRP